MNLIDLIHHPVTACLKTLRREPHAAARRSDDRPRIECLESRIAPAHLLVAVSGHTLNITGDADANNVTIQGDADDPTIFHLSSSTDTFNGGAAMTFDTLTGVTSISIKLLAGDDVVTFGNTVPIHLQGSLSIDGGDGANEVSTTDLKVAKNFSITNGTNTTGTDQNFLTNLSVGGSLTIKNGDGDTKTRIVRNAAATATDFSTILGNLSVTNGSGRDTNVLNDTNVGKNVTFNNGHGDVNGAAESLSIYNVWDTSSHTVIGGSLSVKDIDGASLGSLLGDVTVLGNVSYDHGAGSDIYTFDGVGTKDPVFIRGSLTIKGTGFAEVDVTGGAYKMTGLIVGKDLSITGGSAADTLNLINLQVGGATKLALGDGANIVTILDSTFLGAFGLTTGAGGDQLNLDTASGTSRATIFEKPVSVKLGAGADAVSRTGTSDANQALIVYSTFVIHRGGDLGDSDAVTPSHEFFPLGGSIVVVP